MKTYTKRELKNLRNIGAAKDITNYDFTAMKNFLKSHDIDRIGVSYGVYGMTGGLLQDAKTKELFVILERNSALFQAM